MNPMVRVRLPPVLRSVMGGQESIEGGGATIEDVLRNASAAHPALGLHLFDESGNARRNIVCLHRGDLLRAHEFSRRSVNAGDELILTNALAGG